MFHVSGYTRSALVLCAMVLCSCSGSGKEIERAAVSGTVTYDGEPLAEGSIQFLPDVNSAGKPLSGKAVQAIISDGAYSLNADEGPTVGMNKIMVNASKKTGKFQNFDGKKTEITKPFIPAKYNVDSTLKFDVRADGNTADFALEAK
ncbi:MAG: hypothetical protein QM501_02655 [Gimesia sp.]